MKKARLVKVGDVVQFPHHCFDERRRGWNGWIFRAGIVERIGKTKDGVSFATLRYCSGVAGRYQLLPCKEATKNIKTDFIFEYNSEFKARRVRELLECERNGEPVCWDEDSALLVNHGLI